MAMRSEKKYRTRILLEVTVRAYDIHRAERRWINALQAIDSNRYPDMKITQQIEPYWIEMEETTDVDDD